MTNEEWWAEQRRAAEANTVLDHLEREEPIVLWPFLLLLFAPTLLVLAVSVVSEIWK